MLYVNDERTWLHTVRDHVHCININQPLTTEFLVRSITIYSVITGLSLIIKIRNMLNSAFCAYERKYKESHNLKKDR